MPNQGDIVLIPINYPDHGRNAMDWAQLILEGVKASSDYLKNLGKHNVRTGDYVAIHACDDKYILTDTNDTARLAARNDWIGDGEKFIIVDSLEPYSYEKKDIKYGDKIALRSVNNKKFVSSRTDIPNNPLMANVVQVKEWEEFTVCRVPKYSQTRQRKTVKYGLFFALMAYNELYVMYDRDGDGRLYARAAHINEWETFVFINPEHPK
jgi:hypothetical protein